MSGRENINANIGIDLSVEAMTVSNMVKGWNLGLLEQVCYPGLA